MLSRKKEDFGKDERKRAMEKLEKKKAAEEPNVFQGGCHSFDRVFTAEFHFPSLYIQRYFTQRGEVFEGYCGSW